jgi:O-acetyl-ADP-ribose deacetylase (regulator of RNase III)
LREVEKVEVTIQETLLRTVKGDITKQNTDAIVNAANSGLRGGGGVDGAIHRAGGPAIMEECRAIGGCRTGDAVITTGGRLKARFVIHAVGPRWSGGSRGEQELLASAYRRSMEVAEEEGLRSLSFPSISTGAYGYPVKEAASVALETVAAYLAGRTGIKEITFVLFSGEDLAAYEEVLCDISQ